MVEIPRENHVLNVLEEGAGPPLVFLHGLGGNIGNWILQRRHFSKMHRVVSIDLPGHGRSGGKSVRFHDYWQAVEAALNGLNIAAASFCGLATGARVALALAAHRPERVSRLVAVNASLHFRPPEKASRLALYDLLSEPSGVEVWATQLLESMGVSGHPTIVRGFMSASKSIDPIHIHSIFRQIIQYDQRPELQNVYCPALLIRGQRDDFIPAYCLDDLAILLGGAEIALMPTAGHLPYLEEPSEFNRLLEHFLLEVRSYGD